MFAVGSPIKNQQIWVPKFFLLSASCYADLHVYYQWYINLYAVILQRNWRVWFQIWLLVML